MIQGSALGDFALGYELGKLAIDMVDKYKFDAVKSIKDDGVYVEVKEMVIGSDGHATGSVRQTTLFKLNPSTGKYQEVSTINTVEDILNSIINNPILKGFTATNLATS
jgi:hypothetical protein